MARKKYSKEVKEQAINSYLEGKGVSEISKEMNIPTSTVGTWLSTVGDRKVETKAEVKPITVNKAVKDFVKEEPIEDVVEVTKEVVEEVIHDKDAKIKELEAEIEKLHEVIFMIKEEAKREINTLKDAIIIMAKNYDN